MSYSFSTTAKFKVVTKDDLMLVVNDKTNVLNSINQVIEYACTEFISSPTEISNKIKHGSLYSYQVTVRFRTISAADFNQFDASINKIIETACINLLGL